MKKSLFIITLVTVSLGAFVSCSKESEAPNESRLEETQDGVGEPKGVEINVIADKLVETKTAVVDDTKPYVKWLSTDAVKVFEIVDGSVYGSATSSTTTLSEDDGKEDVIASFKTTIPGDTPIGEHSYKYTSVYPAAAVRYNDVSDYYYLEIPASQALIGNNFSADSDILISSVYNKGDTRVTSSENVNFAYGRLGTVVKLTLKGITVGEKIQEVVITAPVDIAGSIQYDPVTGTCDPDTMYDDSHSDTITLTIDDLVSTGTDVIWFRVLSTSWDEGEELGIEVTTNKAKYYRNAWDANHANITIPSGGFDFVDGGLTKFGVNLADYRVVRFEAATAGDIVDGSVLVFGGYKAADTQYYALGSYADLATPYYSAVFAKGGDGYLEAPTNSILTITLEDAGAGKFYMKDSEGKYLYYSGSGNSVSCDTKESTDNYKWSVGLSAISNVQYTTRKLQFNAGSPRFACYTSAQQQITLYKQVGPRLSGADVVFSSAIADIESSTLSASNLTSVIYTCTSKPDWIEEVSFEGNTMNVESKDNKTLDTRAGIITVKATGSEGEVSANINVSQAASVFASSSTNPMNFMWDDYSSDEIKEIIVTSTYSLTSTNLSISGTNAEKFEATVSLKAGTIDQYLVDVNVVEDNDSGADYTATLTVSRDDLGIVINLFQANKGTKINQVLFHESFGDNPNKAREWNDSYSVKTGVSAVYSGVTSYSVSNVKQGKNTTGFDGSGLNQSAQGTDAYIIIGPLSVSRAENMVLTYQWKAASVSGTYSTKAYYSTSSGGSYTLLSGTGTGTTSFVECRYSLPAAAQVSTLYLKIVWNTSNTQAIIDEVNLQGDY